MNLFIFLDAVYSIETTEEGTRDRINRFLGSCILNMGSFGVAVVRKYNELKKYLQDHVEKYCKVEKKVIDLKEDKLTDEDVEKLILKIDEKIKDFEDDKKEDLNEVEIDALEKEAEKLQENENKKETEENEESEAEIITPL